MLHRNTTEYYTPSDAFRYQPGTILVQLPESTIGRQQIFNLNAWYLNRFGKPRKKELVTSKSRFVSSITVWLQIEVASEGNGLIPTNLQINNGTLVVLRDLK